MGSSDSLPSPHGAPTHAQKTFDPDAARTQADLFDDATAHDLREPLSHAYLRVADAHRVGPNDVVQAIAAWRHRNQGHERPLLDRYEDLGPLGTGGGGEVRLARDRRTNQQVAIKWLHLQPDQSGFHRAFDQESSVPVDLGHPNILQVRDRGVAGGRAWIVTSYYPGGTFLAQMKRARPPHTDATLVALLRVLTSVAEIVAHAHQHGVVHADVKPGNIIMGADGRSPALIDWGLARPQSLHGLFRTGGSLYVMSPEQARGEQVWTPAIDLYALGSILAWCLLGHPPRTEPRDEVLAALRAGPPAPTVPDLRPGGLAALVRDAMHPDYTQRLADARAFARRLRGYLTQRARHDESEQAFMNARARIRKLGRHVRALTAAEATADALARAHAAARAPEPLAPLWAAEDARDAARLRLSIAEEEAEQELRRALGISAEHAAARHQLASLLRACHERAEARGDLPRATRLEIRMRALGDPDLAAYLAGTGTLSLRPSRPGLRIQVLPLHQAGRRWTTGPPVWTGIHSIEGQALPAGDHLVRLTTPEGLEIRHPVVIRRSQHTGEGGGPLVIPPDGALGPDDVFVTGGWHTTRGHLERVHTAPFIVRRDPVQVGEYLRFLDALTRTGSHALAHACAPREGNSKGPLVFPFRDGRWRPGPDPDGTVHDLAWPVLSISPDAAHAFMAWLAAESGHPWRLGTEREFDRMARGPFLWRYPWGPRWVPGFAWTREAQGGRPTAPSPVGVHEADQSVFGVRDIAGNVCELLQPDPVQADGGLVVRGGSWAGSATQAELGWGGSLGAGRVSSWIGLRPYRTVPLAWRVPGAAPAPGEGGPASTGGT